MTELEITHTHTNLKAQQSELQVDTDSEVFLAGLARVVLCDFTTALVLSTQHTVPSVLEPVSAAPDTSMTRLLCDSNVYAKSALTET